MKALKLIVSVANVAAFVTILNKNRKLKDKLDEIEQKYWEGNMQIALYSDDVNKLECKRAYWKINSDGYYPYCSNCGYEPDTMTDYCGSCGYDMRQHDQ